MLGSVNSAQHAFKAVRKYQEAMIQYKVHVEQHKARGASEVELEALQLIEPEPPAKAVYTRAKKLNAVEKRALLQWEAGNHTLQKYGGWQPPCPGVCA